MTAWKYYEEERERHADLNHIRFSQDEAKELLEKADRHFLGNRRPPLELIFTRGNRFSRAGSRRVILCLDPEQRVSVLTVIHELGHRVEALKKGPPQTGRWHGKFHMRFVSKAAKWCRTSGILEKIVLGLSEKEKRIKEKEVLAASGPSLNQRILSRQLQVKRLERKVKMLTTRLKTARRSLSALERAKEKSTNRVRPQT